jgi:hypothetical protein
MFAASSRFSSLNGIPSTSDKKHLCQLRGIFPSQAAFYGQIVIPHSVFFTPSPYCKRPRLALLIAFTPVSAEHAGPHRHVGKRAQGARERGRNRHDQLVTVSHVGDLMRQHSFHLVCLEGKTQQLLAKLMTHELDLVLSDAPAGPESHIKAYNHLLGECAIQVLGTATRLVSGRQDRGLFHGKVRFQSRTVGVR